MSDEDATRIIARISVASHACRARGLNGKRHDTCTNGQHYTAADRRPTNQVSVASWTGKSPDTPDLLRTSSS